MVTSRLFTAEQNLFIASLAFTGIIYQIFEEELVITPGMGKNGTWRNFFRLKSVEVSLPELSK